ncbi:MAG: hypothetical protein AB7G93_04060 [Bdellovibrionales bacterium]
MPNLNLVVSAVVLSVAVPVSAFGEICTLWDYSEHVVPFSVTLSGIKVSASRSWDTLNVTVKDGDTDFWKVESISEAQNQPLIFQVPYRGTFTIRCRS